jgi:hypothetical protein
VKYERTNTSFALEDWFDQHEESSKQKQQQEIGNAVRNLIRKPTFKPAFSSMPDLLKMKSNQRIEVPERLSDGSGYSVG